MGIAISLAIANISVIILKMIVLNKKLGANKRIMFTKWITSWKVAILPVLLGTGYLLLFDNSTIWTDIIFAVVFGIAFIFEFFFVPSLVGEEYKKSLYPILISKLKLSNK